MIYFVTFVISALLLELGFREKDRNVVFVLVAAALLLPALLAGVRDETIGTDRLVYGDVLFYDVIKSQDLLHLDGMWTGWIEPGYIYLNVLVGKIYPNVNFFYFVLSLIEGICVIASFRVLKIKKFSGFAYAAYLFLFFQPAMNALRQSLSVSVGLLCVAFILRNRKILAAISFLLAVSFHNSAVIILFIPIVVLVLLKNHTKKMYVIMSLLMLTVLAGGDVLIDTFAPILNMEASRYNHYFNASDATGFSNTEFAFALFQFFFIFINYKKFRGNSLKLNFFVFISVASVPLSQILMFGGDYIGRLIILFNWLMIPMYALVLRMAEKKRVVFAGLSVYLISYWFYHYIYWGWNQTYPYTSKILGLD